MQQQTTVYPQQGAYPAQQGGTTYYQPQGQQQFVQTSPGQTVIIQTANVAQPGPRLVEHYPAKASLIMGGLQLSIGILLIILNIVALCINAWLAFIGHGFWCGVWFIMTGAFGIAAGRSRTMCSVITFMTLSIIASLVALVCLSFSATGAGCDSSNNCRDFWDLPDSGKTARTSIGAIMAILSGVEGIVAIISSALCCSGVCCGRTASTGGVVIAQGPSVQYVTTPGQPVAFAQGLQPVAGVASTSAGQPMALSAGQPMASAGQPMASAPPSYVSAPPAYSETEKQRI